jgi:diketogulonate reductase-like aldo/keto reductase
VTRPFTPELSRRALLLLAGAAAISTALPRREALGQAAAPLTRVIPSSGERIPGIGMGTWLTFDVVAVGPVLDRRVEILRRFFDAGGALIDSSPMYGHAEGVVGRCLEELDNDGGLFSATKVWSPFGWQGERQIEESHELWGVRRFDLFQIHNLRAWETHAETLRAHREAGRARYLGVTTSHGRRHDEMARLIAEESFDFVQLTYNLLDREAEARLLPVAAEHGRAVIVNRPFRGGSLIASLEGHPLPPWAAEIDCATWPQLLLKWIVSHPAVTCAIPATSDPDHMTENMKAAHGPLPDEAMRRRLVRIVEDL